MKKAFSALSVLLALAIVFSSGALDLQASAAEPGRRNAYPFVFVHGYNGWGGGEGTPSTPKDLIKVNASGDWTATVKLEFDQNNVQWANQTFFGFLAMEGEDY